MDFKYIKPSKILSQFIKHYWSLEINNLGKNPSKHRILPHGFIEMYFHYGKNYIAEKNNSTYKLTDNIVISGQQKNYTDFTPTGKIGFITAVFYSQGAKMFFETPMNKITNKILEFGDVAGKEINDLDDKIQNALNNDQRIELIENYLIKRLIEKNKFDYRRISYAISMANQKKGEITVNELANYACLSPKQLERTFSSFVGLKPKQFLKTIRFQSALYYKQTRKINSLTELAHLCGYFDQSHFINDFKTFTGYTPKKFFDTTEAFSDYFSF